MLWSDNIKEIYVYELFKLFRISDDIKIMQILTIVNSYRKHTYTSTAFRLRHQCIAIIVKKESYIPVIVQPIRCVC